ncbi:MAG: phosphopyruvate hydratase [Candidatus Micrarchaeota archaeon]|nr:phosphopyruvate hydratase [Candidatus Micrarchaeota archaeon]
MTETIIEKIKVREILDSRGNPTVEVDLWSKCCFARAAVPSGASTGTHEALELRDKDERFLGKGVLKAIKNATDIIAPKIVGMDAMDQKGLDEAMLNLDGTENKSNLGANAILGISMAAAKLAAMHKGEPLYAHLASLAGTTPKLPTPSLNIINGGAHAGNALDIQEFMILPYGPSFRESMRMASEIYHTLKGKLKKKYGRDAINVGDEGGFAPPINETKEALNMIMESIEDAGYSGKVKIGLDSAASGFYENGVYKVAGKELDIDGMVDMYSEIAKDYPIRFFEDPMDEEDWEGFQAVTKALGDKVTIIGDDLLVTNIGRIKKSLELKATNGLLLKVNQIGTVTESIDAANLAMTNNWDVLVSHRSGETCDSFIADIVVGLGTGLIKSGAPCRSERLAKYNQLMRIEEEMEDA